MTGSSRKRKSLRENYSPIQPDGAGDQLEIEAITITEEFSVSDKIMLAISPHEHPVCLQIDRVFQHLSPGDLAKHCEMAEESP